MSGNGILDRLAEIICRERWGQDGEQHTPGTWDHETAAAIVNQLGLTEISVDDHRGWVTMIQQQRDGDGEWQWPE